MYNQGNPQGQRRPTGGAIFPNREKASQNHPDYTGDLELDMDTLRQLVADVNAGMPARLRLAGWLNDMKNGGKYLRIKAERSDRQPAGGQQGGYGQQPPQQQFPQQPRGYQNYQGNPNLPPYPQQGPAPRQGSYVPGFDHQAPDPNFGFDDGPNGPPDLDDEIPF